jgi:hypothetical protein
MTAVYLYLNAALYLIFAIWMTLSPWKTAMSVGYESLSQSGKSEYLVIYGGLQLGFSIFYGLTAASPALQRSGLLFSLCLYAPLVVYRAVTVIKFWPVKSNTLIIGALEVALLLGAIVLSIRAKA